MAFTCSCVCSCSWSVSSAVWGCCGVWTGFLAGLLPHEAGPSVSPSTVSGIAPLPRRLPGLSSGLPAGVRWRASVSSCAPPFARSKAGGERATRVSTAGFACPNQQCKYFGNTDDQFHAAFWRWQAWPGRAHPDLSLSGVPHHIQRSTQHSTLASEKPHRTKSQWSSLRLPEGLDPSAAMRVFGFQQATITRWLTRAGGHAEILHERCFRNLHVPHLQVDEIRTRLRRSTQILWVWLVIDPTTKILPVLQLGPRTQNAAHTVIHSLRQLLAPGCIPLFTSDGLHVYF